LTELAGSFNSELNKPFNPTVGNELLVFMDGMLTTAKMDEEAYVAGLLCETINENIMGTAQCTETIQDAVDKGVGKFVCPDECTTGTVVGNIQYHPRSNLCRAMVQSGEFTNVSGVK